MTNKRLIAVLVAAAVAVVFSNNAMAGWKLAPGGQSQAVGALVFSPSSDWNRSSAAPGKQGASWTRDGFELNRLDAFAGVPNGQSLFKERSKKQNPMPKFDKSMLLPDLADFFERSFRIQYQVSDFVVDLIQPTKLANQSAILVRYQYSLPNDELDRKGEVVLAVKNGSLFAINFQAPAMHYFDLGVVEFREIVERAQIK